MKKDVGVEEMKELASEHPWSPFIFENLEGCFVDMAIGEAENDGFLGY